MNVDSLGQYALFFYRIGIHLKPCQGESGDHSREDFCALPAVARKLKQDKTLKLFPHVQRVN
jgi:hypothetical protein